MIGCIYWSQKVPNWSRSFDVTDKQTGCKWPNQQSRFLERAWSLALRLRMRDDFLIKSFGLYYKMIVLQYKALFYFVLFWVPALFFQGLYFVKCSSLEFRLTDWPSKNISHHGTEKLMPPLSEYCPAAMPSSAHWISDAFDWIWEAKHVALFSIWVHFSIRSSFRPEPSGFLSKV